MNDLEGFNIQLTGMGEVFNKEITPSLAEIYWRQLEQYTDDEVTHAFGQALATLKFFPRPSELVEIITGGSTEQGHEAWGQVMNDLRGNDRPTEGLENVIRMLGGWSVLKTKTYKELEFVKRDFMEIYTGQVERGVDNLLGNNVLRLNRE